MTTRRRSGRPTKKRPDPELPDARDNGLNPARRRVRRGRNDVALTRREQFGSVKELRLIHVWQSVPDAGMAWIRR